VFGDPADGIGCYYYRCKGGGPNTRQGPRRRFFCLPLVGGRRVVLDLIVLFKICVKTAVEIALEQIKARLFRFHARVFTQACYVPVAKYGSAATTLFCNKANMYQKAIFDDRIPP